jgi:hypothetical protein
VAFHWFLPTAGDSHGITSGGQALGTEHQALGIEHFIPSGQPHLEEAYRVGENVLPLLNSGVS